MGNPWARDRVSRFYYGFGLVGLGAIAIGFSTTFILPMYRGTFVAIIYLANTDEIMHKLPTKELEANVRPVPPLLP